MLRRTGYILALIASIQVMGGHWAVLQTCAWIGMAVEYTRSSGLVTGITETFDGSHPCPLCKKVAKGRAQEEKQTAPELDLKLVKKSGLFAEDLSAPVASVDSANVHWPWVQFRFSGRSDHPPTPPPRNVV